MRWDPQEDLAGVRVFMGFYPQKMGCLLRFVARRHTARGARGEERGGQSHRTRARPARKDQGNQTIRFGKRECTRTRDGDSFF